MTKAHPQESHHGQPTTFTGQPLSEFEQPDMFGDLLRPEFRMMRIERSDRIVPGGQAADTVFYLQRQGIGNEHMLLPSILILLKRYLQIVSRDAPIPMFSN
ncbi:hypothetical protein Q669_28040 [Labrenzia sp. C1B10]|nr:hypothetical protein Q669_28040 [Labrenzia sp. C1B10]ERS06346.1 hypothetical protein Q675_26510 [Labrenzia sp. C1B70]